MRYAFSILIAQSFPYFLPFRRAGTRLLFVKWLLSKPKVGLLVVPKNVCIYVPDSGESPCDLSSCSKHRAAFRDRYSTVHRFVNVFFKSFYEKECEKTVSFFSHSHFLPKTPQIGSRLTSRCLHQSRTGSVSSAYHNSPDCRFRRASALPQYFHFDRPRLW